MVTTGMVFGVFDGLHEGHRHFLNEALKRCERLIVVITQNSIVKELKGHPPKHSFEERRAVVTAFLPQSMVVAGDVALLSWGVLQAFVPDMVFLGYDQDALERELKKMRIPSEKLSPHLPHEYKSAILNQ